MTHARGHYRYIVSMQKLLVISISALCVTTALPASGYGEHKVKPPVVIKSVEPKCPKDAPGGVHKFQATFIVDEAGLPRQLNIIKSDDADLNQVVLDAIGQYRFKPATKDGQPVRVDIVQNVEMLC